MSLKYSEWNLDRSDTLDALNIDTEIESTICKKFKELLDLFPSSFDREPVNIVLRTFFNVMNLVFDGRTVGMRLCGMTYSEDSRFKAFLITFLRLINNTKWLDNKTTRLLQTMTFILFLWRGKYHTFIVLYLGSRICFIYS